MNDWEVHIADDWQRIDGAKLYVFRRSGVTVDVLTGFSEVTLNGLEPIYTTYRETEIIPVDTAIHLPRSALRAIAEALKPGPSQGEVKALADTLAIERGRVDDILRRATIV